MVSVGLLTRIHNFLLAWFSPKRNHCNAIYPASPSFPYKSALLKLFPCLSMSFPCFLELVSMCFPCVFHVFAMFSEPSCCKKHPQGLAELTLQPAALALPARSPRPRSTRRPGTNWGRSSSKKGMPQLVVSTM